MRYHYKKPEIYSTIYGDTYICDHSVYNTCTLFKINEKGLAVIQQRYDEETKSTYWTEIDPWLVDDLYLHNRFEEFLTNVLENVLTTYILWSLLGKLCGVLR